MGSKNKLKRFKENQTFANVVQPAREELLDNAFSLKGRWRQDHFKNDQPIVLELGCGKGEYSIHLAEKFPDKNYEKFKNKSVIKIVRTISYILKCKIINFISKLDANFLF